MEEELRENDQIKECIDLCTKIKKAEECIKFLYEMDILYPYCIQDTEILLHNVLKERLFELKMYENIFISDNFPLKKINSTLPTLYTYKDETESPRCPLTIREFH